MESHFEVLELLLKANNKEKLREVVKEAYSFEGPGGKHGDELIKTTMDCLSLETSTKAIQLLRSMQKFERSIVHQGLNTPSSIEALLPETFQSKLKKFLVACIQENVAMWSVLQMPHEIFAPKLVDFDWTISLATASSKQSNLNVPICTLELQILEPECTEWRRDKRVLQMELNQESLDMLLDRLSHIREQLNTLSNPTLASDSTAS